MVRAARTAMGADLRRTGSPSPWVARWSHLVRPGARVLDLACGTGRHVHWFAARGALVTGIDRDAAALALLRDTAAEFAASATAPEIVEADLEAGAWPLADRRYEAVVVTNYLWRPRLIDVVASVDAGGVLIYETFARGQQSIGKPSNPAFLLEPGELLRAAAGLHVIAYEDGFEPAAALGGARFVQRLVALREHPQAAAPARHELAPAAG